MFKNIFSNKFPTLALHLIDPVSCRILVCGGGLVRRICWKPARLLGITKDRHRTVSCPEMHPVSLKHPNVISYEGAIYSFLRWNHSPILLLFLNVLHKLFHIPGETQYCQTHIKNKAYWKTAKSGWVVLLPIEVFWKIPGSGRSGNRLAVETSVW